LDHFPCGILPLLKLRIDPPLNKTFSEQNPHYLRGIIMTLVTTLLWGFLPVILKIALNTFSAGTIASFRFFFAFVVLYLILSLNGSQPHRFLRKPPLLGILAGASLAANYFAMTQGVNLSSPSNAAILIQLAPVLMVVVGLTFFKERVTWQQLSGFVVAALGFYLFYRDQLAHVKDMAIYSSATGYIFFAAAIWVLYISCQKTLSRSYGAQSLNLLVYGVAAVVLVTKVEWAEFLGIGWKDWLLLVILGINTLLAYGALAEAVKCIPLTIISPVITMNPMITLMAMLVLPQFSSGSLVPETIGTGGYIGAVVAIVGVVLVIVKK
jgi:drug/metabolite transporter (DMT)-like permease